jgi:hypothetical protein
MAKAKPEKAVKKTEFALLSNLRLQVIILVVLSFILYGKALKFGFNYLDDSILVIDNYKLNSDYHNIKLLANIYLK